MSLPSEVERYLQLAEDCERRAAASAPGNAEEYLKLAALWRRLAADARAFARRWGGGASDDEA